MKETHTHLEFFQEPNGPKLAWSAESGVKLLEKDGLHFKDLAKDGELHPYEDWRLPAEERARDLAARMTIEQIAGLMLYSRHQFVPGLSNPYFGEVSYEGKSLEESGLPLSSLTDQQREFITNDFLRHVLVVSVQSPEAAADFRKQTVFLHDTQDGLGITVDTSLLQHQPHPAVAICTKAALPLFRNHFCKGCVFLRPAQTMDKIIVSTSGYLKEAAHNGYRIFVSVPVDHGIFSPWLHFHPVECRKSRNSSFSILSRLFSYLYSASVFADLLPRVFGRTGSFRQH